MVEAWRPFAQSFTDVVPPDFSLDWIQKESSGNRCNKTTSAGFPEIGLWQLDAGNMRDAGTDEDTLRHGCTGQYADDSETDNDIAYAFSSGIDYVKSLKDLTHSELKAVGQDWSESTPDFWALVRLQHAAGKSGVSTWLVESQAKLGRGPSSWDEFVASVTPTNFFNHWSGVAAENGSWVTGWNPPTTSWWRIGIAVVGLAVGAWLASRHRVMVP